MHDNDVTKQLQQLPAAEALQEIEAFNTALLNFAPYPILITNLDSSIRYINPALETLTGYTSSEVIGLQPPFPWWPPEKEAQYQLTNLNFQNIDTFKEERYFRNKNGEIFWVVLRVARVLSNGEPRFFISNWVDVTENKRNQEQLKRNEKQLRDILDSLNEGVALISPDLKIIEANKAELQILGIKSLEQIIGKSIRNSHFRHISADQSPVPLEKSPVAAAIKKKQAIRNFEEGLVGESGTVKWLNVNAVPLMDEMGRVSSVVRTIFDITEQHRLLEEKEQFTKKLLDVQEEERKRISRELHDDTAQYLALLSLEMGALIEKGSRFPPEMILHLKRMQNMVDKALQEVRRFSHELRPGVLEQSGLATALELIIGDFNATCQTEISFECDGKEKRLTDEAELALFRIAQEALNNIRKHSEAGSATVNLSYKARKVRLIISDNGKGFLISPTQSPGRKDSLGLIGMRERAHLIGAPLTIKSQPGQGTTITIEMALKAPRH